MSYIDRIAYHLGRRDEVPNQELARELAEKEDESGFDEMAGYLFDDQKAVASDCLKVLYEAGYIKPEMIVKYTDDFLKLLRSKHNRMVWGAMIALWNVAPLVPDRVYADIDRILDLTATGTVITHVTGIKVLLVLAKANPTYYDRLYPVLRGYLKACRPIDFAKRVEDYMLILNNQNKSELLEIISDRYESLNKNQASRIRRALKKQGIIYSADIQ